MKNVKFFVLKFIILNIVNLIAFAVSYLADMLTQTFSQNQFLQTAIVCLAGFAVFAGYTFSSTAKMKQSDLPFSAFVIREAAAYMIFMIPGTVGATVVGPGGITSHPLTRFYLPNLAFAHIFSNAIAGFIVQTLIITAVIMFAHARNRKKYALEREQAIKLREQDEKYADELLKRQQQEREDNE